MYVEDWEQEDKRFTPKRKVNNRFSKVIPHIIGSFYSCKMKRVVEYESLSELIFYYLLELDTNILRYYVQPVEIPIGYIDKDGKKQSWMHIPDVLVFRKGSLPTIYQIKGEIIKPDDKKLCAINSGCEYYTTQNNWNYSIAYPKMLPDKVIRNIKFLNGFLKERREYSQLMNVVVDKVKADEEVTILELSKSFTPEVNYLYIIPVIYHLVAKGVFYTNISTEVNQYSVVTLNKGKDTFLNDFYYSR